MEIVTRQFGEALEVKVKGRLDNYWGEHLQRNIEELVRGGAHHLRLNFSEVSYLSSAGVGLLVRYYRQLNAIGGSFAIIAPSDHVKLVIDLCHLSNLLLSAQPTAPTAVPRAESRHFTTPVASFDVIEYGSEKTLICETIGDPALLKSTAFGAETCHRVKFSSLTFGLGLGAFGHNFLDARERFGEFLAVAGAAAYQPTDDTNIPDFMVSSGDFVPEMLTLYGLRCEGAFSYLLRFEALDLSRPVSLIDVLRTALDVAASPDIGIVIVAESAGLVGAALRRSPAVSRAAWECPEIRDWLSFSTERLYARSLAVVAGIASVKPSARLASLLRPLGGADLFGHCHAAAFSYRPLPKGEIDLKSTVTALFESERLQGVLHLLADNRETAGPGESEFVRGACWIGPIT